MKLAVENNRTFFTNRMKQGDVVRCPVAHGEGNYICDEETLKALKAKAASSSAMSKAIPMAP